MSPRAHDILIKLLKQQLADQILSGVDASTAIKEYNLKVSEEGRGCQKIRELEIKSAEVQAQQAIKRWFPD
jgi:hypothetical protein